MSAQLQACWSLSYYAVLPQSPPLMKNLTVKSRLLIVTVSVAAVLVAIGSAGLFGMSQGTASLKDVFEGGTKALQTISTIDELVAETHFSVSDAVLDPSAAKTQAVTEATARRVERIDQLINNFLSYPLTGDQKALATQFASNWRTLRDKGFRPVAQLLQANNLSEAQWVVTQTIEPTATAVKSEGAQLRELQLASAQAEYNRALSTSRIVQWVVAGSIAIGVGVVALLCASLARMLFHQLGGEPALAASIAHRVSEGDLSVVVPVKNGDTHSMMYAMSLMRSRLSSMIGGIQSSADTIANTTTDINAGNTALAGRTEEQAASIEQTSASMEQLASTVKANADHAVQARELASVASAKAREGDRAAADAVLRMQSLAERSAQIREITSVIEGISFQTNLLALNAAVEAARAGTQGRGFAVVAQEVRGLAERSSTAAKEIAALIRDVTTEVDSSGAAVKVAGETIVELLGSVTGVTELVDAIASASREQSAGIDQFSAAVSLMDRMTQQNSALVQDSVCAANALETQAQQLRKSVQTFRV